MQRKTARRSKKVRGNSIESLETRVLLAADWQNPIDSLDVDASGNAANPVDALLVINELNSPSVSDPVSGMLPELASDPPPFFDVDGNGGVNPLDALLVINALSNDSETDMFGSVDFQPGDSVIVGMPASHSGGIAHDTLVNDYTRSVQSNSAVAATTTGNSVVVWESLGQDGSGFGIFGQRYDNSGAKSGNEFQINEMTRGAQRRPSVAIWEDGSFIVTWDSVNGDGWGFGVKARMFNANGTAMTDEFQVNETAKGSQTRPVVTVSSSDFSSGERETAYIAWSGRGTGDRNGVFWTTVDMGSTATSGEMRANSTTGGIQRNPTIDVSDDGLVAIAWQGKGSGDNHGVFMDVFASTGGSVLGETRVNGATRTVQQNPSLSFAPRGSLAGDQLVVAWKTHSGEPGAGVRARQFDVQPIADSGGRFALDGDSVIQVNETTRGAQKAPAVAYLDDSTFLVSWFGNDDSDHRGVYSRQFASDGTPLGSETRVNETTRAGQVKPAVAAASQGYILTWEGRGDSDNRGVFARFVDTEINANFRLVDIVDIAANEGEIVMQTIGVVDLDGVADSVVFSLGSQVPAGFSIDPQTGVISWQTNNSFGGQSFVINVIGTDATGFSDDTTFTVTVNEVAQANNAPVLAAIADQTVQEGSSINVTASATDPDGDTIIYSARFNGDALPSWITLNSTTGAFTISPQTGDAGSHVIQVTATDNGTPNLSDTVQFGLTVEAIQLGFTLNIPAQPATVGQLLTVDLDDFVTTDGTTDPGVISFVVSQLPHWLVFNATTNVVSGIPSFGDVGTTTASATGTGSLTGSFTDAFSIVVTDAEAAPRIFDQALRVSASAANGTMVGTVIGSDPNEGDTLMYAITAGNDVGAFAINANTGVVTVADATALTNETIVTLTVQATDSTNRMGSGTVTVAVNNAATTAGYSLQIFDVVGQGSPITTVQPGQEFELRLFVVDQRMGLGVDDGGVFSAFADIVYDSSLVYVTGDIVIASLYNNASTGSFTTLGLLDEVGGLDGLSPFGTDPQEVARIRMTAGMTTGNVQFATDFADDAILHPTLQFGESEPVLREFIEFGTTSLTIGSTAGATLLAPASSAHSAMSSIATVVVTNESVVRTPFEPSVQAVSLPSLHRESVRDDTDGEEQSATDELFARLGSDL